MSAPVLWLLAGPNGSGKSTFAQSRVFERLHQTPETDTPLVRLNPDEKARGLRFAFPILTDEQVALRAAQQSDAELDGCIERGRSVLVETVLSSDKLRARVEAAKARGADIRLTYVLLRKPELNIARVAQRVAMGGHGVEEQKIRDRWVRSLENLPWFAGRADTLSVWDNSRASWDGPPELVLAATREGRYVNEAAAAFADPGVHPKLKAALAAVIADL